MVEQYFDIFLPICFLKPSKISNKVINDNDNLSSTKLIFYINSSFYYILVGITLNCTVFVLSEYFSNDYSSIKRGKYLDSSKG